MNLLAHYCFLLLIPSVILIHLYYSPYTKVEESFNIQAIHDILVYGIPTENTEYYLKANYDHVTFPGSVPRSFIGAVLLSGLSRPWLRFLNQPEQVQLLVRAILGIINALSLLAFQQAIVQAFGNTAGYWYILLQASQFHVMYYATRTLPNMFAFALTTLALRFLVLSSFGSRIRRTKRVKVALYLITVAGVIFRSELAILVATVSATLLVTKSTSLRRVIAPTGIFAALVGLLVTVGVDSFFWQRMPLWPEWVAFRYNTIEGKASEWGTSPLHFYFTNSVPRLMLNPMTLLVCIPVALSVKSTRRFSIDTIIPLVAFVALYSLLPHKEWRFIVYVIPGLTAVASSGASWIWSRKYNSLLHMALCLLLVASTIGSFCASTGLLYISSLNYPGAIALKSLHMRTQSTEGQIQVHLDDLTCQTGVTRFLEFPPNVEGPHTARNSVIVFDKTEDPVKLADPVFWQRFDFVLAEYGTTVPGKWDIIETIDGFGGISISREPLNLQTSQGRTKISAKMQSLLQQLESWARAYLTGGRWLKIRTEPKINILRKSA